MMDRSRPGERPGERRMEGQRRDIGGGAFIVVIAIIMAKMANNVQEEGAPASKG